MDSLAEKENQLEKALESGDTETAVSTIYELIVAYAQKRDFSKAEALRERLYSVDPMAINEIVKSGEIIEQEKNQAVDRDHLDTWAELYSKLDEEQRNELYFSLAAERFEPENPVFREGEGNSRLFFLERGQVNLYFKVAGGDVFLKTLGPGQIFGAETFFSRTVRCTYTAEPLTSVQCNTLDQETRRRWNKEFGGLISELHDFCFQGDDIPELIKTRALDRRRYKRFEVTGTIAVQVLDSSGNPLTRPFKGELEDISVGGLAFSNQFKKRDTAHSLLSRRVATQCKVTLKNGQENIKKAGRIVAVHSRPFNEHSFHVSFEKPLPQDMLDTLDTSSPSQSPDMEVKL